MTAALQYHPHPPFPHAGECVTGGIIPSSIELGNHWAIYAISLYMLLSLPIGYDTEGYTGVGVFISLESL